MNGSLPLKLGTKNSNKNDIFRGLTFGSLSIFLLFCLDLLKKPIPEDMSMQTPWLGQSLKAKNKTQTSGPIMSSGKNLFCKSGQKRQKKGQILQK